MPKFKLKKLALCLTATLPMISNAYEPSVTTLGMGGIYATAWMDGLIPVYQNNQQLLYSDLQLEGNNTNSGILSVGGGYRQQINAEGILGGYLFYDRERSAAENYYNVISPGIEYLTPTWRFRLNYYAPIGTKTYLVSQGLSEDFGNTQDESFSGNTLTDSTQYNYESLSYGTDLTLAYRFQADKRWQINLSPYVFNQTDSSALMGINAQLNFYTNDHTTFFLGDGYDNANQNRVFIGVSLTFGGHNNDDTVDNLMNAPVYRNLDVNTTARGLPVSDYSTFSAPEQQPGFYAFVNDAASDSANLGTYEDPYTSVDEISSAPDDAQIRIASTGTNYNSTSLTLVGTQTMAGYTNDYKTLATENNRPIIQTDAGVMLNGNNTMTSLQVLSNGSTNATGITISGNATLNNVNVGSENSATSFQTGVRLHDGASGTINNSTVTGYKSNSMSGNVTGIESDNGALEINNSTITAISETNNGSPLNYGINQTRGTLTLYNTIVNCISNAGNSHALFLQNTGDVTVSNSTITSSSTNGNASGIYILTATGNITVNNSSINASSDASNSHAYGIYSSNNNGNMIINNSQITVQADETAIGVDLVSGTGSTTITNNTITATATSATGISGSAAHTGNTYDINGTISSD